MTHDELKNRARQSIDDRIREGIKALLEQVMEEELTEQLQAGHRERTATRTGERNGHYTRDLVTAVGQVKQLRVPRAREGSFLTEVFERYRSMTGNLEEAVLEMYLQGVSTRKIEQITGRLSGVKISKDATSRIAQRLDEALSEWRTRRFDKAYPYLYLDATYLKVNWSGAVRDMALLMAMVSTRAAWSAMVRLVRVALTEISSNSSCASSNRITWISSGSARGNAYSLRTVSKPMNENRSTCRPAGTLEIATIPSADVAAPIEVPSTLTLTPLSGSS
jgi:hypothetical protein